VQIQFQRYCGAEPDLLVTGLPEGADAMITTRAVQKSGGRLLFVARDDSRASAFIAACQFFAPDIETVYLPAWDCLPYDRISPSRILAAKRAAGLHHLATRPRDQPLIIVATVNGVGQYTPPREVMTGGGFSARAGEFLQRERLESYLADNGYSRASTVLEPGDYAVRGGLIDVYSPALKEPVRLDFFGDELESVRTFDVRSQRTIRQIDDAAFTPVSEVLLTPDTIARFRRRYVANFGGGIGKDPVYASISEGIRAQGLEHYLPLFYDQVETVFDYAGSEALIVFDGLVEEAKTGRYDLVADLYRVRADHARSRDTDSGDPMKMSGVYRPLSPDSLYLGRDRQDGILSDYRVRRHSPFIPPGTENRIDFGGRPGRSFSNERRTEGVNVFDAVVDHIRDLKSAKKKVWLSAWTDGSRDRLDSVLSDHGVQAGLRSHGSAAFDIPQGSVAWVILPVEQGFEFGDLVVVSEEDILGERLVNRSRRRRAKNFISESSALNPGDPVIHIDHGLGRYLGLKTLDVQSAPHDCLELEYAGGAKLYLPVENIELLSRYGAGPDAPALDKLGGAAWQSRKAKAKKRLRDMAAELVKVAAERVMRKTDPIEVNASDYNAFAARFPYVETDDQLNAVDDVLNDLAQGTPMDRLICGDVGFGKTEVALRGAFTAVMAGHQVAIVVPTTLLCRQHFQTFSERFRDLPVNVRQLSRLVSTKDAKQTKADMASGKCDIVIGTHALLAKNIKFAALGLLIVDEEQRFGVSHKERLKSFRANVHVLTLTATPIPRTLQMALSGIRDLSLMVTPPVDRLAVRTYVSPFDPVSVRKALLREKYRGGQSFFVAPRISDLSRLEDFLRDDVPEVKYVVAHGRMAAGKLEDIMTAFYDGEYDVLLTTSIIESGIDIPSVNTMIIYRADHFGLAQLYQMRGRIGRSKIRAYAYLTMPDKHVVTKNAVRRLKVLQALDALGAGFTLASHDLDVRGGGNLLGEEQSGHIKDVGVELYQHMLEEAVAELKNGPDLHRDQSWSPQINLGVAVLIPGDYIKDLGLRLATYRRIADIEDEESGNALAAELVDRFGPLPIEVEALLTVMKIKRLCRKARVEKVDAGPRGIVLTMRHTDIDDPLKVLNVITQNEGWRLRPDQTILVPGNLHQEKVRTRETLSALCSLAEGFHS